LFICGVHDCRLPVGPKRQRLAGAYECSLMSQHLSRLHNWSMKRRKMSAWVGFSAVSLPKTQSI
jgi:hypothetical protein